MSVSVYIVNGVLGGSLSPADRGLAYGDGVFRTLKVQHGAPQWWDAHYQKLAADCSALGIVCPAQELLRADISTLFDSATEGVCKIIVTRGEGERGYALPAVSAPNRVLIRSKLPQYSAENFNQGVVLTLCQTRLSVQAKLAGIKHLNRLENVLARAEWQDTAIFDGVMCNTQGDVIECTSANIFARFGRSLLTPDLSQCGVAGVTRALIIEAGQRLGLEAKTAEISLENLLQAEEVIVCNSLYGAFQVKQIGENNMPVAGLAASIRAIFEN